MLFLWCNWQFTENIWLINTHNTKPFWICGKRDNFLETACTDAKDLLISPTDKPGKVLNSNVCLSVFISILKLYVNETDFKEWLKQ